MSAISTTDLEYAYVRGFDAGREAGKREAALLYDTIEARRRDARFEAEQIAAKAKQRPSRAEDETP